jgi:hypothetical protein
MQRIGVVLLTAALLGGPAWSQVPSPAADDSAQLRQEVEQLKKTVAALEERLDQQEQKNNPPDSSSTTVSTSDHAVTDLTAFNNLTAEVNQLDQRVRRTETAAALQRIRFSGDFRFEAHTITGSIPSYYNGLALQNLIVRTMFYAQTNGGALPSSISQINNNVASHYGDYLYFTSNLTFSQLKAAMASIPPATQQQLINMLRPSTYIPGYGANNSALYTNRLRLDLDSKLADNLTFEGRLSMYKVFGDSTGVQVFDGQPTSINIDGTTARVPNSDILRVERAFFTWSNIADLPLYLSIGRRPSTDGPPMNLREDEPRGGTPMGSLIDFQFDGITIGYHAGDKTTLRVCWGLAYESGFGNGDILQQPGNRLSDTNFIGGDLDLYSTEKTLLQVVIAHAFDVPDGFNGLTVLPLNPVTGDPIGAPVVLRYTPSTDLGAIDLAGVLFEQRRGRFDYFGNVAWDGLRPNGQTSPFGGMGSDPFETPVNHNGYLIYTGLRYNFPNHDRTKLGFEFNHGSKYWFNFAQGQDDIIAPKTSARGNVYEAYILHRIMKRLIVKADFIHYQYQWSGSGFQVGAPQKLNSTPTLGFPTYDQASMGTLSFIARF